MDSLSGQFNSLVKQRADRPQIQTKTESLILAQDERWRRA
jgi:hypothetical protein